VAWKLMARGIFGSRFVELRRRLDGRIPFSFWKHSEETGL